MDVDSTAGPYDLVIRGARVIDTVLDLDRVTDIAIQNGSIAGVGSFSCADAIRIIDGSGLIASPGWIDLHAHVFAGDGPSGVQLDREAGVMTGVTTAVDAGSSGAGTWEAFQQYVVDRSETRALGFLNVSLVRGVGPRHGDWRNFDQRRTIELAERAAVSGSCVGIKVLASQTHCGNMGITPVKLARQAARLSGTRLMVHIGNAPPVIEDVLTLLDEGDIVTHCWHGKHGGLIGRDKKPLPEVWAAVERGVKFDIGHGSSSFSFETARRALDAGLPVHSISTDIHRGNVAGPVIDQATTMSKFLHLGMALPDVIRLSTLSPAQLIQREHEFGQLRNGSVADITLFQVVGGEHMLTDSQRKTETATQLIEAVYTIRSGRVVKEPLSPN